MTTNAGFQNLVTGLLFVCAVVVTGLVVRRELRQPPAAAHREVHNWAALAAEGRLIGDSTAPIKVVLFSDFQCPACARAKQVLADLANAYPDRFAILYRHFPLSGIHPYALDAAIAAECAGQQGRFTAYHDVLFERQHEIGGIAWEHLAEAAGVANLSEFAACLSSPTAVARVERDIAVGDSLALNAVPSFVVEGRLAIGSAGIDHLQRALASAR